MKSKRATAVPKAMQPAYEAVIALTDPFCTDRLMLKSIAAKNRAVWLAQLGGLLVDLRDMPRDVQVVAYEHGMIPYIPADQT